MPQSQSWAVGLTRATVTWPLIDRSAVPTGVVSVQEVQFDVAVTASQTEGKEAKVGIEVVGISLGVGVKGDTQSEAVSVSRLRFSVSVVFPSTKSEGR